MRFWNDTDRIPLTHNLEIVDVYSVNNLPALITAPDGVSRVPLAPRTRYLVHETFEWPRLLFPKLVDLASFEVVSIQGATSSVNLLFNGGSKAHMWGREMSAVQFKNLNIIDTSNSGSGVGTKLRDFVGGGPISNFSEDFVANFNFLDLGTITAMPIFQLSVFNAGFRKGTVIRSLNSSTIHQLSNTQLVENGVTSINPALSFQGPTDSIIINGGNFKLTSGDDCLGFDSALTGNTQISAIGYGGTSDGNFFATDISNSIVFMLNVSVAIASFQDSPTSPGVNTQVNTGGHAFTKGQTILISGATQSSLNGLHLIPVVADDQLSFEIPVVFVTSSTATLEMTRVTSNTHGMVKGQTNTISGTTSYNGTTEVLFETDNDFDIPVAFVANDATGTVVATFKTQKTIGINATGNGAQPDSKKIASGATNANATLTTVIDGVYSAITLTGFVADGVTERFTLSNATEVEWTYDEVINFSGILSATISGLKAGSIANYRFAISINGAVPVFATATYSPMEVKTTKVQVTLALPVSLGQNDTVQVMVAGDGTGDDITITDISMSIT